MSMYFHAYTPPARKPATTLRDMACPIRMNYSLGYGTPTMRGAFKLQEPFQSVDNGSGLDERGSTTSKVPAIGLCC